MSNKVLDGIIGLSIGDAVGVPVEFVAREELKNNPVIDMRDFGTYNQPKGTWSDDTSLTLALIDGLIKTECDIDVIGANFLKWFYYSKYTPYDEVFDCGITVSRALMRIESGIEAKYAGGTNSDDNGNGSLMRILPLAFYLKDEENINKRVRTIYDVSAITHGHIRSKVACHIYIEMAINLLKGYNLNDSYIKMIDTIKSYYNDKLGGNENKIFSRILSGELNELKESEIKSTGYVIHTLEAALWCLLNNNNYKKTILCAVNLGDDSDTVAAVAGGLAGIYYGILDIPENWYNYLARKDYIISLCEALNNKLINKLK